MHATLRVMLGAVLCVTSFAAADCITGLHRVALRLAVLRERVYFLLLCCVQDCCSLAEGCACMCSAESNSMRCVQHKQQPVLLLHQEREAHGARVRRLPGPSAPCVCWLFTSKCYLHT